MRRISGIMILAAGLGVLSGCVGGGYAYSDTYRGVVYDEPVYVAPRPVVPVVVERGPRRYQARRYLARDYRRDERYRVRYERDRRAVGYRYGPRG